MSKEEASLYGRDALASHGASLEDLYARGPEWGEVAEHLRIPLTPGGNSLFAQAAGTKT